MTERIEVYRGIIYDELRDEVLLVQRGSGGGYMPGYYEFPGGKADPNESPTETLQREVQEETGLLVEPFDGTLEQSTIYMQESEMSTGKYAGKLYLSRFIVSRIISGTVQLSNEHDALVWDRVHEARNRTPITPDSLIAVAAFKALWTPRGAQ